MASGGELLLLVERKREEDFCPTSLVLVCELVARFLCELAVLVFREVTTRLQRQARKRASLLCSRFLQRACKACDRNGEPWRNWRREMWSKVEFSFHRFLQGQQEASRRPQGDPPKLKQVEALCKKQHEALRKRGRQLARFERSNKKPSGALANKALAIL